MGATARCRGSLEPSFNLWSSHCPKSAERISPETAYGETSASNCLGNSRQRSPARRSALADRRGLVNWIAALLSMFGRAALCVRVVISLHAIARLAVGFLPGGEARFCLRRGMSD
jgi:hypothetical protein